MKKQPKTKEKRRVKKMKYFEEELPEKDKDGIDITSPKSILKSSDKILIDKTNACS